jgi:signal transduction histidine kinase
MSALPPPIAANQTTTTIAPPPAPRAAERRPERPEAEQPGRGVLRPLIQARTWRETAFLLLDLPVGVAMFTIVVTMLSVGVGLLITLIGLPLLVATIWIGRLFGVVERARSNAFLGTELRRFPRPDLSGSWWSKAKKILGDGPGWRGLAYGLLMLPWGILTFTITVTSWALAVGGITYPIWQIWTPSQFGDNYVLTGWGLFGYTAGVFVLGLVMLILTPRIVQGLATLGRGMIRVFLSPGREDELTQRVEALTVSRGAAVEGAATELARIERDLHDGAQQRLVALAMDLGMARERLESGGDSGRATELVVRAHEESKQAIAELRELVRGIHPSVLSDRGLDAALSALAARSPVPVQIDVTLPARPPAPIEAAAYFVVAEALTNVAKHSRARHAWVNVSQRDSELVVEIRDDGVGGATVAPRGGLSGLRDRVTAVDGRFRIASPEGGPTMIVAELPCAS